MLQVRAQVQAWRQLRIGLCLRVQRVDRHTCGNCFDRGHAPALSKLGWPQRMMSCVMGCQRHFEERVRLGEERATNLDLARSEWDRLLAAAESLAALAELSAWDPTRP